MSGTLLPGTCYIREVMGVLDHVLQPGKNNFI